MELEQQMGYVVAKLEELREDSKAMGLKLDALEKRVDAKLQTAEATFRVFKWLGSTAVAAIMIPWEKLIKFWS